MNLYNLNEKVYSISLEKIIVIQGILSAEIVNGVCSRESIQKIEESDKTWRKRALYLYRDGNYNSPMKMIPEIDLLREESLVLHG